MTILFLFPVERFSLDMFAMMQHTSILNLTPCYTKNPRMQFSLGVTDRYVIILTSLSRNKIHFKAPAIDILTEKKTLRQTLIALLDEPKNNITVCNNALQLLFSSLLFCHVFSLA